MLISPPLARLHEAILALMQSGGRILVVGRNSTGSGYRGVEDAVDDFLLAQEILPVCDTADPSEQQRFVRSDLVFRLGHVTPTVTAVEGGPDIRHRFLIATDWLDQSIIGFLAAGTARRVDDNGSQPFVDCLSRCIQEFRPRMLLFTNASRLSRWKWSGGRFATLLQKVGAVIVETEGLKISDLTDGKQVEMFLRDYVHEQEAARVVSQVRNGQHDQSGKPTGFDDSVTYAMGPALAPGLVALRMRQGSRGSYVAAFLHRAASLPPRDQVAFGYPEASTPDGVLVDQVELVRRAIQDYAANVPRSTISKFLCAEGYSTEGLRRWHRSSSITYLPGTDPGKVLQSLLDNLEYYKSGVLTRQSGYPDIPETQIVLCPEGGWVPAAVADKAIARRDTLKEESRLRGGPKATFTGLRVTVKTEKESRSSRLALGRRAGYYRMRPPGATPYLNHALFVESLAGALATAGPAIVGHVFRPDTDDQIQRQRIGAQVRHADSELVRLAGEEQTILDRVVGDARLSDAVVEKLNARIRDIGTARESHIAKLGLLREQLAALEGSRSWKGSSLQAEDVLRVVATLRDPTCLTHRDLWLGAIQDLEIVQDREGRRVRWKARLVLQAGQAQVDIPFKGQHALEGRGQVDKRDAEAQLVVERMRTGIPAESQSIKNWRWIRPLVAEKLGYQSAQAAYAINITDPRLLRITTGILASPSLPTQRLAAELGEPVDVVERIRAITRSRQKSKWVEVRPSGVDAALRHLYTSGETSLTDLANAVGLKRSSALTMLTGEGLPIEIVDGSVDVIPCTCGSRAFGLMAIPEPVGAVCLGCWEDRAGLSWPKDSYSRYLRDTQDWARRGAL